jgi:hypothetical protein
MDFMQGDSVSLLLIWTEILLPLVVVVVVTAAAVFHCQEHGLHAMAFSVSIESLL